MIVYLNFKRCHLKIKTKIKYGKIYHKAIKCNILLTLLTEPNIHNKPKKSYIIFKFDSICFQI